MSTHTSGDRWTAEYDDGVIVFEFLPGMELAAFGEAAYPVYERYLEREDARGLVTVVEIDDPFDPETFEVWERTASRAVASGLDRWAVVADGIKAISLRGKIDEPGLETDVLEDRTEAIEWVRG